MHIQVIETFAKNEPFTQPFDKQYTLIEPKDFASLMKISVTFNFFCQYFGQHLHLLFTNIF